MSAATARKSMTDLLQQARRSDLRRRLMEHEALKRLQGSRLDAERVTFVLGQYWYPLRNFPHFLSGLIFKSDDVQIQALVSDILYQELGEGDPGRAHSSFYTDTMRAVGLDVERVVGSPASPETAALVAGYNGSLEESPYRALGCLYGTEISDLLIVSSIGQAVRSCTGAEKLPWVDIHVKQEPDHVANVNEALGCQFDEPQSVDVLRGADHIWSLWIGFFDRIGAAIAS